MSKRKPWDHAGSRHERGYDRAWDKARAARLAADGHLCQPCQAKGRVTVATEVHHIKAKASGGTDDLGNLVSTCHACHVEADLANRGHRRKRRVGLNGYPID